MNFWKSTENMYQHAVLFLFIQIFIGDGNLKKRFYKLNYTIVMQKENIHFNPKKEEVREEIENLLSKLYNFIYENHGDREASGFSREDEQKLLAYRETHSDLIRSILLQDHIHEYILDILDADLHKEFAEQLPHDAELRATIDQAREEYERSALGFYITLIDDGTELSSEDQETYRRLTEKYPDLTASIWKQCEDSREKRKKILSESEIAEFVDIWKKRLVSNLVQPLASDADPDQVFIQRMYAHSWVSIIEREIVDHPQKIGIIAQVLQEIYSAQIPASEKSISTFLRDKYQEIYHMQYKHN